MNIWDRISELGVKLIYTKDLPPQRLGCYLDDERTILIRASLHGALEQETLAHEYVHAVYRDRTKHPAVEWRAWREASRLLVDPAAYAAAERVSHDVGYIARELGVTIRIVQAYRKAIHRGEISVLAA
jgi:Zn-dependent peptidase ImmA (M78 family)